jgi:hypothetical protein
MKAAGSSGTDDRPLVLVRALFFFFGCYSGCLFWCCAVAIGLVMPVIAASNL